MFFDDRKLKKQFNFDELVSDAVSRQYASLEQPISQRAFLLISAFLIFMTLLVFLRVLYLNTSLGAFYSDRSIANVGREIKIPAPRGLITDRFDKPLLENEPTFSAVINLVGFFKADESGQINTLKAVAEIIDIDINEIKNKLKNVNLEKASELLIAKDIPLATAIAIKDLNFDSISIVDDYRRFYFSPAFSHILGYTGEITPADMSQNSTLNFGDEIGKSGLELFYDDYLRGQKGVYISFRDATGNILDGKESKSAISGQTLKLTIDADFQQFFHDSMASSLKKLDRHSGVGLAVNPKTGEVLASLSFPNFDNNIFTDESLSDERAALLIDPNQPLFNRVIAGVYSPGSTIKPLVALAALSENIITPKDIFFSKGYLEVPNPYHPDKPSIFVDWKAHGWVDLFSSLARSSNIYYYHIGGGFGDTEGLGISRLYNWWVKFGLNKPTGIDLPGEKSGFLPTPVAREKRTGEPWRLGDTYNVSIGQGDLMITPIELISYISAIANDGLAYRPHLNYAADKITPIIDVSSYQKNIKLVEEGLEDAVTETYGTAHLLDSLPMSVAAKTGSAQIQNNQKTNAFIVAYAPVEDPTIAVLILVEDAKEGSLNTVPIAYDVLDWYYHNRLSANQPDAVSSGSNEY